MCLGAVLIRELGGVSLGLNEVRLFSSDGNQKLMTLFINLYVNVTLSGFGTFSESAGP